MRVRNIEIEDRVLLKKAIEKQCNDSLSKIYLKYESFIAKYIGRKVTLTAEIQDLTQTVFLSLCEGKCKYSGRSDAQGYLCGIAKNVLRDYFKAQNRQIVTICLDDENVENGLPKTLDEPSEILQNMEVKAILRKAVSNLPKKSRQAIEMIYFDGVKITEISKEAGCDSRIIRDRVYHGITKLQKETRIDSKKYDS